MGWTSYRVVVEDTSKGVNFSQNYLFMYFWLCWVFIAGCRLLQLH